MKKTLLVFFGAGLAVSTFAQGLVQLENAQGAQYVTLNTANGPLAAAGSYQVALLWFNGTSFQQIGAVYQTSASTDGPGYFFGETVTLPTYTATGTFIVQAWQGNYATYAAAYVNSGAGAGSRLGQTPSFVNAEGNGTTTPPGFTALLSGGTGSGWSGQLIMEIPDIPEPSTIALGCLGGAMLLLFRRRK